MNQNALESTAPLEAEKLLDIKNPEAQQAISTNQYAKWAALGYEFATSNMAGEIIGILNGIYDTELRCLFYTLRHNAYPSEDVVSELSGPSIRAMVESLKRQLTDALWNAAGGHPTPGFSIPKDTALFILSRWLDRPGARSAHVERTKHQKELHDQSKYGTVAEIAELLGVSKKQVRAMKRHGVLDAVMSGDMSVQEWKDRQNTNNE